ncbi:MAG: PEP-CTERM sorting domain-containing protein [Luteolibacter sp.]
MKPRLLSFGNFARFSKNLGAGFAIATLSVSIVSAQDGTWAADVAGDWGVASNWVDNVVPGGSGSTVTFSGSTALRTITLDANYTVGTLNLEGGEVTASGNRNWNLNGGGLTFDNGLNDAALNISNRAVPGIASPITVSGNGNLTINKTGASNVVISGGITGAGTITTNAASGTAVSVTGATSYAGTWVAASGQLNMNTAWQGSATTTVTLGVTGDATAAELQITSSSLAAANTITATAGGTRTLLANATSAGTVNTGNIVLDGDLTVISSTGTGTRVLNLAAASGSTITGAGGIIVGTGNNNVNLVGAASNTGTNQVSGANFTVSTTGSLNGSSTVVSASRTFTLNGDYTFDIGANGVNDSITGAGAVNLNGDFIFNLSLANLTEGNIWNIVAVDTLTENFGGSFAVANAGAVNDSGVWTFTDSGNVYEFSQSTGNLTLISVPEPSVALLSGIALLGLLRRRRAV